MPGTLDTTADNPAGTVRNQTPFTVMSAGIVGALTLVAQPQLTTMLRNALSSVG